MAVKPEVLHHYLAKDLSRQGLPITGDTWPDMTLKEAFASSLVNSLTKKFVSNVAKDADSKALSKFLACNRACENWELRVDKIDSKTETILGELKRIIDNFWFKGGYSLFDHPYDLLRNARVGPGVSRGANGTDFYTKLFSSKLTCSNLSLYSWYKRYTQRFPEWANAELIRHANYGEPSVASSKLSFVPKNDQISRCICIEPSLNTFFQLGMEHVLTARLKGQFGIDLAEQQLVNRDLARLGSITDGLSTIDLSSASDTISMKMLEWLLPKEFLQRLVTYRTSAVEVEGVGTVPLNMISTMGNGYTFPLQTMIFAGVVIACMRFRGLRAMPSEFGWTRKSLPRSRFDRAYAGSDELWGVNGDDIVCPRSVTADVINILNLLGFSVNDDKSFTEGPFRESCGSDFFNGVDIRGVYIKDLTDHASFYTAINLLVRFSVRSEIRLDHLVGFLLGMIPKKQRLYVTRSDSLSGGIHSPSFLNQVRRYRRDRDVQAKAYTELVAKPVQVKILDERVWSPKGYKMRIYNPSGLLISFLQGSINSSSFSVRNDAVIWKRKRRYSSSWDAVPLSRSSRGQLDYGLDWQRWDTVAYTLFND